MKNVVAPVRTPSPLFRWSWKLVTIKGIDVYIHATFLLLVAFVAFSGLVSGQGLVAMLRGTLLILAVFATVVLHELGHALMARRFGIPTRDITLLPVGGVARLVKMPDAPEQQLLVALAGPATSAGVALGLFVLLRVLAWPVDFESVRDASGPLLTQLLWINVFLAAFNLAPAYPMDGGRVLRALLAMRLPPEHATQIAARVGQGVAVVFGLVGLFTSPFLVVIAAFVWLGAQAEVSTSRITVALHGRTVRDGMITDFQTVSPSDALARVVDLTLAGFQQDFPVMDGTRLVGVLTQADLLKGLAERGASMHVEQAMRADVETVSPFDALDANLARMREGDRRVLMVVVAEKVVGLLTLANIGELLALEAAGGRVHPDVAPPK